MRGAEEHMRVLVVDDESDNRQYLAEVLKQNGYEVSEAADGEEALRIMGETVVNALLTDLMMPRMDGFELLRAMRSEGRIIPAIVMTAFGSLEKALSVIHDLGGFWFLEKPVDVTALNILLSRAVAQDRLIAQNEELRRELAFRGVMGNMVGQSPAMTKVFDIIRQVAPTSASVLITGESGTGKELVARALHDNSRRAQGPFIAMNCAAIPETLIESELFGHEKGAFTGAVERRIGAIESAKGGTLFLDELAEMPMPMQAKLLRFLEDFQFRRLGSRVDAKADVRIVAATNREPLKAIADGKLREDLYYRVNVFHIELPPLRERKSDIPLIVDAMIHNLNRKHETRVTHAGPEFLALLQERPWEGNVRELRNVVERAVILAGEGALRPIHIPFGGVRPATVAAPAGVQEQKESGAKAAAAGSDSQTGSDAAQNLPIRVGLTVDQADRVLIEATLAHVGMNRTRAAAMLDISLRTLGTRLREYGMTSGEERNGEENPS
jgi:DNA-binding NtrC family response regulator